MSIGKEINECTKKLVDKLVNIGLVRNDIPGDKTPTNRHHLEIHLLYDNHDIICIDCKDKFEYLCFYPFLNYDKSDKNEPFYVYDMMNIQLYGKYCKDLDYKGLVKKYNKFLKISKLFGDNLYTIQCKRITENNYETIFYMFKEIITINNELKKNILNEKFMSKIQKYR